MYRGNGTFNALCLESESGTPLAVLVPPKANHHARLTFLDYRDGGTRHTLRFMKALWRTKLSGTVAAAGTSATLLANAPSTAPSGDLAVGDWLCFQLGDGTYFLSRVKALSSLTVTVDPFPASAGSGLDVFCFGAPDDHEDDAANAAANPLVGSTAYSDPGEPSVFADAAAGILQTLQTGDPLMVYSDCDRSPGLVRLLSAVYTQLG